MKGFLLLLLFCLTAWSASAQSAPTLILDNSTLDIILRRVALPLFGLYLLCNFVLAIIKLVLNYLLKRQIVAAAVPESVVERLMPSPQDEQKRVVKWVSLLLSSGVGLMAVSWYSPLGIHSVVILLFSTAFGFLAYYFFLRRQPK